MRARLGTWGLLGLLAPIAHASPYRHHGQYSIDHYGLLFLLLGCIGLLLAAAGDAHFERAQREYGRRLFEEQWNRMLDSTSS